MGLGKSIQAISLVASTLNHAYQHYRQSAYNMQATLLICPPRLLDNWANEITKHSAPNTLNTLFYHGPSRHNLQPQDFFNANIIITSYGIVSSEYKAHHSITNNKFSPLFY